MVYRDFGGKFYIVKPHQPQTILVSTSRQSNTCVYVFWISLFISLQQPPFLSTHTQIHWHFGRGNLHHQRHHRNFATNTQQPLQRHVRPCGKQHRRNFGRRNCVWGEKEVGERILNIHYYKQKRNTSPALRFCLTNL